MSGMWKKRGGDEKRLLLEITMRHYEVKRQKLATSSRGRKGQLEWKGRIAERKMKRYTLPGSYWSTWMDRVRLIMPATPERRPRALLCFLFMEGTRDWEIWTFIGTNGLCNSRSRYSFTLEFSPSGSPSSGLLRKDKEAMHEVDWKSSSFPSTTRVPLM